MADWKVLSVSDDRLKTLVDKSSLHGVGRGYRPHWRFFQNAANRLEYSKIRNKFASIAGTLSVKLKHREEPAVTFRFHCQEPLLRSRITLCLFVQSENSNAYKYADLVSRYGAEDKYVKGHCNFSLIILRHHSFWLHSNGRRSWPTTRKRSFRVNIVRTGISEHWRNNQTVQAWTECETSLDK
jgi:hypothetical protein